MDLIECSKMAQMQSDLSPGKAAFLGSLTRSILAIADYTQHPNSDSEYVVDKCKIWIVSESQLTDHLF